LIDNDNITLEVKLSNEVKNVKENFEAHQDLLEYKQKSLPAA
jgi:hypothetical protein